MVEFTYSQKEKLCHRIHKLKSNDDLTNILKILKKHNPDLNITTNLNGQFMYFHNLKTESYTEIERYLNALQKMKTKMMIKKVLGK